MEQKEKSMIHDRDIRGTISKRLYDDRGNTERVQKRSDSEETQETQMIKPIVKDTIFLGQKSEEATRADLAIADDLRDTLADNREHCVGMAANMIGIRKRIIIANMGMGDIIMFNPVITKKDSPYDTEESCLSLIGTRKTKRYKNIEVEYTDLQWNRQRQKYSGFLAQIIQHECDHLEGIII